MNRQKSVGIGYCDYTWNPVVGCTRGCEWCWARRQARRIGAILGCQKCWDFIPHLHPERLEEPLSVKKPSRIAVSLMGDLFDPDLRIGEVADVMRFMVEDAPQHTYLVLTKQPEVGKIYMDVYDNIHYGVSVTGPEDFHRIDVLCETPAAVRFVSWEPMIDYLPLLTELDMTGISWLIIGAMSGPLRKRYPCKMEWVRDVVQQCKSAGVACYVKQLHIDGKVSHDPAAWPEDLRVREFPETN